MKYEDNAGYAKILRAKEDRKFMSMYYNAIISTKRFSNALTKGIKNSGEPRQQEYEDIIFSAWNDYLVESGRALPSEKAIADKEGLRREVFDILSKLGGIEFNVIDLVKNVGAVKFGDVFYEVSLTKHKKPAVQKLEIASKLNSYIEEFAEELSKHHSLIRVKNNAITVENDGSQTTINFTRKKKKLF